MRGHCRDLLSSHHLHCPVRLHLYEVKDGTLSVSDGDSRALLHVRSCVTARGVPPWSWPCSGQTLHTALKDGKTLETAGLLRAPSVILLGLCPPKSGSPLSSLFPCSPLPSLSQLPASYPTGNVARGMIGFALLIRIYLNNVNCFVNHGTIILYKMCKALVTPGIFY